MGSKRKILIASTGASGSIYFDQIIKKLEQHSNLFKEVAIVLSKNAKDVFNYELNKEFITPKNNTFKLYNHNDYFVPFASGSSSFDSMIIIPCSMGTLARIANGISENLITRAADVMLKERRNLVLVTRETPLNTIHIDNMKKISMAGGLIFPASPSFYFNQKTIEDVVDNLISRVLNSINIDTNFKKWQEK